MVIDMNEDRLVTLPQLRQFVEGTTEVEFRRCGKDEDRYRHIEGVLRRFGYARLKRADKGLVRALPDAHHRLLAAAVGAADQARPSGGAEEGLSRADARLCPPLHRRRRGAAGGHRHAARHALRAGHPALDATRAGDLWRCPLRPPGDDLDRAFVQPAPAHRLHSSAGESGPRPARPRSASASVARRRRRGGRASSASTACIRAIRTG